MYKAFILYVLIFFPCYYQHNTKNIIGTYYSVNNQFEKYSILSLLNGNRFEYHYVLGGCQATVTGKWKVTENRLFMQNDDEFISDVNQQVDSVLLVDSTYMYISGYYPNLGLCEWKIGKNWVKPAKPVDNGCFEEKGKHKRR